MPSDARREARRNYYLRNRARILAEKKAKYYSDLDGYRKRAREASKRYYAKHENDVKKRNKQWFIDNREWRRKYDKDRYPKIKAKKLAANKKWRAGNKDRIMAYKERNRVPDKVRRVLGIPIQEARRQLGMGT